MALDDEILQTYIDESREHLADIEQDLLTLEQTGAQADEQLVNKVFRAAHSIKGGAGFFDLTKIRDLAHKIENVLDLVRGRSLVPNPEVINILLLAFDKLREMINHAASSESEDISEFVVSLTGLTSSYLPKAEKASLGETVRIPIPGSRGTFSVSAFDLGEIRKAKRKLLILSFDMIHDLERKGRTPLSIFHDLDRVAVLLDSLLDIGAVGGLDDQPTSVIPLCMLIKTGVDPASLPGLLEIQPEQVHVIDLETLAGGTPPSSAVGSPPSVPPPEPAAPVAAETASTPPASFPSSQESSGDAPLPSKSTNLGQETSLRVQVPLLEQLMSLAGELVLARNQLTEAIRVQDFQLIKSAGQRVHGVTSELQEAVMKTRLQPLGVVFSKFPRVIRDMARQLGKELRFQVQGEEVELDKTLIEALSDPLTHLIRNAADHGIEAPAVRADLGKAPVGTITLNAFHEAGQVIIEITDDGKGLDTAKIVATALRKGLISQEVGEALSDREKMNLIFLPGLSTAEKVSDVSGRGVGMDVVKSNLEKLGGQVDLESSLGRGTRVRIKLPLTLAIIPSLLVTVGEDRFALPQVNVQELIRLRPQKLKESILKIGDAEVLSLRGDYIPLVSLAQVFAMEKTFLDPLSGEEKEDRRTQVADRRSRDLLQEPVALPRAGKERRYRADSDLNIVVLSAGSFRYGLVVDRLHDTMEIVVKPLGSSLKGLAAYAGATIMGDGRIALILDVVGLAELCRLQEVAEQAGQHSTEGKDTSSGDGEVHSLLAFRSGSDPCAIALGAVDRVDALDKTRMELLGNERVLEYRGKPIILFQLEQVAKVAPLDWDAPLQILVMKAYSRTVGMIVNGPVEAVSEKTVFDDVSLRQPGIIGSALLRGKTTLIVNPIEAVHQIHPEWEEVRAMENAKAAGNGPTVLLAEDSDFFRKHIKGSLEGTGYQVLAAKDGQEAWEVLQGHPEVRAIVSDIEMPRLDGLGLARKVRSEEAYRKLPMLAVSSLASDEDQKRGMEAGFTAYQIKLDVESLLGTLSRFLGGEA